MAISWLSRRWNIVPFILCCPLLLFTGCCMRDPMGPNLVYQGRTDDGVVVSLTTNRIGEDVDRPRSDDERPTFVIAQPDGSTITLRPKGGSPADYEVLVNRRGAQESVLSLTRVYCEARWPDPSVYTGTLLPVRRATDGNSPSLNKP